jgi:hypothetical protein
MCLVHTPVVRISSHSAQHLFGEQLRLAKGEFEARWRIKARAYEWCEGGYANWRSADTRAAAEKLLAKAIADAAADGRPVHMIEMSGEPDD